MSTEWNSENPVDLYQASELPRFDQRQAWTGRLEAGAADQFMTVGDAEVLRFSAGNRALPITRSESEMSLIRRVVSSGTVSVPQLGRVKELTTNLSSALDKLTPPSEHLNMVYEVLQTTLAAEEINRGNEAIYRAAGYIAARKSIWVVTKSLSVEAGRRRPRNIAVARLVGLAFGESETGRPIVPVVSGKNGKAGKFIRGRKDADDRSSPQLMDVLEGTRTKP